MELQKREQEMLSGKHGPGIKKCMEILLAVGECYGAERMVEISSAHVADMIPSTLGDSGIAFLENLANKEATVGVFSTTNVIGCDRHNWKTYGIDDEDYLEKQQRILRAIEQIGLLGTYSCTPYYHSNLPRFAEHISWSESSTTPFVNSFFT